LDIQEDEERIQNVDLILRIIFGIIIPMTMFLCFFSLSSSMSSNILEQSREIAILRSIGFPGKSIVILYVYEAFIVVTSASVLGIFIGIFVGVIVTL
jgi:ABC-type antimicrobial peptide transport system permease subunit